LGKSSFVALRVFRSLLAGKEFTMDSIPEVLKYFLANAAATMGAVFYWMAVENMQPLEIKQKVHQKLALVFILSLLISPFGAWVVSSIIRIRKITRTLKNAGD
jgi:hypothetical protein